MRSSIMELLKKDQTDKYCCIVARDRWTQAMHADLLSCKGTGDEQAAIGLNEFMISTGYKRLEFKTDGEPALVDVAKAVKIISEGLEIVLKNPPAHDPKANGVAERAVREFKEQLRAVKIGLERRVKAKLDPKLQILLWMILALGSPQVLSHLHRLPDLWSHERCSALSGFHSSDWASWV